MSWPRSPGVAVEQQALHAPAAQRLRRQPDRLAAHAGEHLGGVGVHRVEVHERERGLQIGERLRIAGQAGLGAEVRLRARGCVLVVPIEATLPPRGATVGRARACSEACGRARRARPQPSPPDRRRAHAARGGRAPGGARPHALLSRRARGGRVDRRAAPRARASARWSSRRSPAGGPSRRRSRRSARSGVLAALLACRPAPARGRGLRRDRRGGDRRRGPERPAPAPARACAGAGAPSTWSPAPGTRSRAAHAGRACTPRRRPDGPLLRPEPDDRPAPPAPAAHGQAETAAAAVVARPARAARGARDERARPPCSRAPRRAASARWASPPRPTSGAARRCPAPTTTSRASPRCSRSRRWCASSPLADLRLLLVSCGAEETLQDGIRGVRGLPPR